VLERTKTVRTAVHLATVIGSESFERRPGVEEYEGVF
jgi:hypothetical protein